MSLASSLSELLFPIRCIACSALGIKLCTQCRRSWVSHIYITKHANPHPLTIYSAVQYSAVSKKILLSSKERSIKLADSLVIEALSHSLEYVLAREWIDYLVPIPSRKSVTRLRGRSYIHELCHSLSKEFSLPVIDLLMHTRNIRDQSGLHSRERFTNLSGAMKATSAPIGRALLVDDLVTTGATLFEAQRALSSSGVEVAGAITACIAQAVSHFSR